MVQWTKEKAGLNPEGIIALYAITTRIQQQQEKVSEKVK